MEVEKRTSLDELSGIGKLIYFSQKEIKNQTDNLINRVKDVISEKGTNGTWMLFGKQKNEKLYCALQVASSSNILNEISRDLCIMRPTVKKRDKRDFKSFFGGNVCKVTDGLDTLGQRYKHIFKSYEDFCIVIVDLDKIDSENYDKKQYAEVKLACKYRAKYWNPNRFNGEMEILKEHKEWVSS